MLFVGTTFYFKMTKIASQAAENREGTAKGASSDAKCRLLDDEHLTLEEHSDLLDAVLYNGPIRLKEIIGSSTE